MQQVNVCSLLNELTRVCVCQYPSVIRANQLCPSRLLLDTDHGIDDNRLLHVNIGSKLAPRTATYVQKPKAGATGEFTLAVLPSLLEQLAVFRKKAKKAMEQAEDPWQRTLWNAKQLAFKICMNSIYGVFGATKGPLTCMELAASTTSIGRQMINTTKRMIEARWDGSIDPETSQPKPRAKVIYGDSVSEDTPILVRAVGANGPPRTYVCEIGQLAPALAPHVWSARGEKWVCSMASHSQGENPDFIGSSVSVWSDGGWTEVQCIIRHRLPPGKRMVRVTTGGPVESAVTITDDHSLLSYDPETGHIEKLSPKELKLGSLLLHHPFDSGIQHEARYMSRTDDSNTLARNLTLDCAGAPHREGRPVVKLELLPDSCASNRPWVYDLTTSNHHFGAGTSSIVVHNTDSCFVSAPFSS